MAIVTSAAKLRHRLEGALRQPAAWYAGFAVYAAGIALFSGPGLDHWWGTWAAGGYAVAAALAARWRARAGRLAVLAASVAGALIAPLTWLATREPATPDRRLIAGHGLPARHGHHGSAGDRPDVPGLGAAHPGPRR